jgi:hypothetical protein
MRVCRTVSVMVVYVCLRVCLCARARVCVCACVCLSVPGSVDCTDVCIGADSHQAHLKVVARNTQALLNQRQHQQHVPQGA